MDKVIPSPWTDVPVKFPWLKSGAKSSVNCKAVALPEKIRIKTVDTRIRRVSKQISEAETACFMI